MRATSICLDATSAIKFVYSCEILRISWLTRCDSVGGGGNVGAVGGDEHNGGDKTKKIATKRSKCSTMTLRNERIKWRGSAINFVGHFIRLIFIRATL